MNNITIGVNKYHGKTTIIKYAEKDRLRHMYMVGKTGSVNQLYIKICAYKILRIKMEFALLIHTENP